MKLCYFVSYLLNVVMIIPENLIFSRIEKKNTREILSQQSR